MRIEKKTITSVVAHEGKKTRCVFGATHATKFKAVAAGYLPSEPVCSIKATCNTPVCSAL